MSDIWVPVVAALGASLLTGLVAFGMEWWRSRKVGKSGLADRRSRAYSTLLTRSTTVMQLATNLHVAMELRSGLREGINVTAGIRKALDPLELADRLNTEMQPLYEAWSEVWVVGSKEAIAEVNDLIARCGAVMGAATQRGKARPLWLVAITGEKWTQAQLDEWQEEMRGLAEARRILGVIARKETGVEMVDLFASNEQKQTNHP